MGGEGEKEKYSKKKEKGKKRGGTMEEKRGIRVKKGENIFILCPCLILVHIRSIRIFLLQLLLYCYKEGVVDVISFSAKV